MKIIPIIGLSNSGKTTLIHALLEKMNSLYPGQTAVIKHLGHHKHELEKGKDTTTHYERGAAVVAGIDSEKAAIILREGSYDTIVKGLSDYGIKYTIIEGFKEKEYKKVVLGDLDVDECLLRDPSVDDVIGALSSFDDYYTMQGLVGELQEEADMPRTGAILTYSGIVREFTGEERTEYMEFDDFELIDTASEEIRNNILKIPGIRGAKLHHCRGRLYAGDDVLYIAIASSHRKEGFKALMEAIDEFKKKLH